MTNTNDDLEIDSTINTELITNIMKEINQDLNHDQTSNFEKDSNQSSQSMKSHENDEQSEISASAISTAEIQEEKKDQIIRSNCRTDEISDVGLASDLEIPDIEKTNQDQQLKESTNSSTMPFIWERLHDPQTQDNIHSLKDQNTPKVFERQEINSIFDQKEENTEVKIDMIYEDDGTDDDLDEDEIDEKYSDNNGPRSTDELLKQIDSILQDFDPDSSENDESD